MDPRNKSSMFKFILLGMSKQLDLQPIIFLGLLATYLVNVVSNSLLLGVVWMDTQLGGSMYFLLGQLALVDIIFTSLTVSQALVHTLSQHRAILFTRCMAQVFLFLSVGNMKGYLLAIYDRYVAICCPLNYSTVVTWPLCLVGISWSLVTASSVLHTVLASHLHYCSNRLGHFFCDLPPLMHLSCTQPILNELALFTESVVSVLSPFIFILVSYGHIGVAMVHLRSTGGLCKTLSTCGSHLTIVIVFYSAVIWLYFCLAASFDLVRDHLVALFYNVVAPALNPLIYSLRNKEVRATLQRAGRKILSREM